MKRHFHRPMILGLALALALMQANHSFAADAITPLRDLGEPKRTQVVATLDTPIENGKNAVWCASFVAAWKHLQHDLSGGKVTLDGANEMWQRLNDAADPTKDVPQSALYASAGLESAGIRETILKEVAARFPGATPRKLPDPGADGFIAYARLELAAMFPTPYSNHDKPLEWSSGGIRVVQLKSFGVAQGDPGPIRDQARVYYSKLDRRSQATEFVLDLNDPSQPIKVWIAQIPRKATLADTLTYIAERCASQQGEMGLNGMKLDPRSTLGVPEMGWKLDHAFNELAGTHITSGPQNGKVIAMAKQDVELQLNRKGATVKSESFILGVGGKGPVTEPPSYWVNGPFLLAMWQRGAANPFLVVWVENDELLTAFK